MEERIYGTIVSVGKSYGFILTNGEENKRKNHIYFSIKNISNKITYSELRKDQSVSFIKKIGNNYPFFAHDVSPIETTTIDKDTRLSNEIMNIVHRITDFDVNNTQFVDDKEFELITYKLIKLIGTGEEYIINEDESAGMPDGLFIIGQLIVLYDCTLNMVDKKERQIENYISMLEKDTIKRSSNKPVIPIRQFNRHVWIITKTNKSKLHDRGDFQRRSGGHYKISVKEIAFKDLLKLLHYRLVNNDFESEQLETTLTKIGNPK